MPTVTLKISGEYRCKESKDACTIKDFETTLKLEVSPGANLMHEAKKDGRLVNHIRKNIDNKCSSVRTFNVKRDISGVKIENALAFEDVPTMKRAQLEKYIDQEELDINPSDYKTKTDLAKAIIVVVNDEVNETTSTSTEPNQPTEEEKRQLLGVEGGLDDRGLAIEELPVDND